MCQPERKKKEVGVWGGWWAGPRLFRTLLLLRRLLPRNLVRLSAAPAEALWLSTPLMVLTEEKRP